MELQYLDYTSQARKRYTDLFKNDEAFDAVVTTITEVLNDYQREIIQLKKQVLNIDLNQFSNLLLMVFNTTRTSEHHVNNMFFNEYLSLL